MTFYMTGVKTFSLPTAEPVAGIYIALSPPCFGSARVYPVERTIL